MNQLTRTLTIAGILPFVLTLAMALTRVRVNSLTGTEIFLAYSTVILSFMAGSLWGQASHFRSSQHDGLLLASNIWALLAWCCLLFGEETDYWINMLILMFGYWHLYWTEKSFSTASAPVSYYALRKWVTCTVILLHILMLLQILLFPQPYISEA